MQLPKDAIPVDVPFQRDCFGCSPTNPHGLKLKYYYHNQTIYTVFKPTCHHSSWGNIVHGGISASICDESLGWLSMCAYHSMSVTKELSFEYFMPIKIGQTITAVTEIVTLENKKRLIAKSRLYNQEDALCVLASATMLLVSPKAAKRLNIMPDNAVEEFSHFLDALTV